MSTPFDVEWLEYDDDRRCYVTPNGVRHIGRGKNAACGAGALVMVLRPDEEIEFKCPQCFPTAPQPPLARDPGLRVCPRCNKPLVDFNAPPPEETGTTCNPINSPQCWSPQPPLARDPEWPLPQEC